MRERGLADVEAAFQMDVDDGVDVRIALLVEARVAQDARIAHQDIEPAERFQCRVHDGSAADARRDAVVAGDGAPAERGNVGDDRVGSARRPPSPAAAAAQIVDHHRGTAACQLERVGPAKPAPAPVTMATRPAKSITDRPCRPASPAHAVGRIDGGTASRQSPTLAAMVCAALSQKVALWRDSRN